MRGAENERPRDRGKRHLTVLDLCARLAGALYFLAVAVAVFAEFVAPGQLGVYAIVLPIACSGVVTVLLYIIFRPVNACLASLALLFNLAGLAFEATQLQPRGLNLGMVLHGVYCILLGVLFWRSSLLPRVFDISMALAGLIWLQYLAPPLAHRVAPLNTAAGLLCEAGPMLWLLTMGVRPHKARPLPQVSGVRP